MTEKKSGPHGHSKQQGPKLNTSGTPKTFWGTTKPEG